MTLSRRDVSELLTTHGLAPSRALGQNFVVDPNTVRRIAALAEVGGGDNVVEIGAGLGSLTRALLETGANVVAIEVDRGLIPILRELEQEHAPQLRVVEADALKANWDEILGDTGNWKLIANLPYNVATPLVADLLDTVPQIESMLVMVQYEVGERFVAKPRSKAYGALSVKVAYWATAKIVGTVSAQVFLPRPKVASALVRVTRLPSPAVDADPKELFALVRTAFGQRRKMLRRSLSGIVSDEAFAEAEISPEARPEELDVLQWGKLCNAIHKN